MSAEAKKQKWAEITDQINGLGQNHREVSDVIIHADRVFSGGPPHPRPRAFCVSGAANHEEMGGPEMRRQASAGPPARSQRHGGEEEEEVPGLGGEDGPRHPADESHGRSGARPAQWQQKKNGQLFAAQVLVPLKRGSRNADGYK